MASPSKRSLQAAALAEERRPAHSSTEDSTANHLLKLASELKERIEVLRILDGTAPQWPGITNCIDMLYDVAAEASEGLQQACQRAQKSKHALEDVSAKLQEQQCRADEAEDALAESNNENSALTAQIQQSQTTVSRLQSELADERLQRERKVDRLKGLQQDAEKRSAALKAECNRLKEELKAQNEDIKSFRQTVAQQVDEMVQLREDLSAKNAAVEAQTHAAARSGAELTTTRRKLQDASTALADADSRGAALTAHVEGLKKEVARDQKEIDRLQGLVKVSKEEAVRAKQWREAQVTVNNDKIQEQQQKSAEVQRKADQMKVELSKTIERLTAEIKAEREKAATIAENLEKVRRQCKVHELEARDAITQAQKTDSDAKRARQEASKATTELNKVSAQCTALQDQVKTFQSTIQEREGAVRQECEKAAVEVRAELSNAQQELAVKAALADSWEREVHQLCKRLEKLEKEKEKLQDANSRMHQQALMSFEKSPQPPPAPPAAPEQPAETHTQGAVNELRAELRALACQLSAQQMGALAHLSAAQQYPPGGHSSAALNWSPALWGRQAAAAPAVGTGGLLRRPRTLPDASERSDTKLSTNTPGSSYPIVAAGAQDGRLITRSEGAAMGMAPTVHWGGTQSLETPSVAADHSNLWSSGAPPTVRPAASAALALAHSSRVNNGTTWTLPQRAHPASDSLHSRMDAQKRRPKDVTEGSIPLQAGTWFQDSSWGLQGGSVSANRRLKGELSAVKPQTAGAVLPRMHTGHRVRETPGGAISSREVSIGRPEPPVHSAHAVLSRKDHARVPSRANPSRATQRSAAPVTLPVASAGSYASQVRDESNRSASAKNTKLVHTHTHSTAATPASALEIQEVTSEEEHLEAELRRLSAATQDRRAVSERAGDGGGAGAAAQFVSERQGVSRTSNRAHSEQHTQRDASARSQHGGIEGQIHVQQGGRLPGNNAGARKPVRKRNLPGEHGTAAGARNVSSTTQKPSGAGPRMPKSDTTTQSGIARRAPGIGSKKTRDKPSLMVQTGQSKHSEQTTHSTLQAESSSTGAGKKKPIRHPSKQKEITAVW